MAKTGLSTMNPLEMWRDALSQWESGTNTLAGKELSSQEFVRALHALSGLAVGAQQTVGKASDGWFKALNLPSRGDLAEINERLQRVETMLEQLLHQPGIAQPPSAPAMPPRTRKPRPAPAPEPVAAAPTPVKAAAGKRPASRRKA